MKYWRLLLASALLACPAIAELQAQKAVTAAGGNTSGGGGTVSFTVGQIVYTTISSVNNSVAQGVQQPYEISVITGIKQAEDIHLFCSVYPNPASDFLTLRIENYNKGNLSYKLFDINGILLENKKVTGNETSVTISNLVPTIYFLKVIDNQKEIKTFKIIKH